VPALDHRLIRLKALPDGFQTEFIETAERGPTGGSQADSAGSIPVTRSHSKSQRQSPVSDDLGFPLS
jgi:hypothetical protein